MISENNCKMYYSGDYDPEGLLIADKLFDRYKEKIAPMYYSKEIYLSIVSDVEIDLSRIKQLDKVKDKRLIPIVECMKEIKKAAYQEKIFYSIGR